MVRMGFLGLFFYCLFLISCFNTISSSNHLETPPNPATVAALAKLMSVPTPSKTTIKEQQQPIPAKSSALSLPSSNIVTVIPPGKKAAGIPHDKKGGGGGGHNHPVHPHLHSHRRANSSVIELKCNKTNLNPPKTVEEMRFTNAIRMLMTSNERILFLRYLKQVKVYLEYGTGGSTELACQNSHLQHFISVESSLEFIQGYIKNSSCLQQSFKFLPHYADIGPTKGLGIPIVKNVTMWRRYAESLQLFKSLNPELILVDGRFRLGCALQALIHLSDPIVMIHDFFWRPSYYAIFDYTEMIDCSDSLIVLKKKKGMTMEVLQTAYARYGDRIER